MEPISYLRRRMGKTRTDYCKKKAKCSLAITFLIETKQGGVMKSQGSSCRLREQSKNSVMGGSPSPFSSLKTEWDFRNAVAWFHSHPDSNSFPLPSGPSLHPSYDPLTLLHLCVPAPPSAPPTLPQFAVSAPVSSQHCLHNLGHSWNLASACLRLVSEFSRRLGTPWRQAAPGFAHHSITRTRLSFWCVIGATYTFWNVWMHWQSKVGISDLTAQYFPIPVSSMTIQSRDSF